VGEAEGCVGGSVARDKPKDRGGTRSGPCSSALLPVDVYWCGVRRGGECAVLQVISAGEGMVVVWVGSVSFVCVCGCGRIYEKRGGQEGGEGGEEDKRTTALAASPRACTRAKKQKQWLLH
jgi:hypothetical protein